MRNLCWTETVIDQLTSEETHNNRSSRAFSSPPKYPIKCNPIECDGLPLQCHNLPLPILLEIAQRNLKILKSTGIKKHPPNQTYLVYLLNDNLFECDVSNVYASHAFF